jgi:type I site-specific restriction-modification system R (restriction) subunit
MNPQLNKVFSKLAKEEKTELASEKVELANIKELQSILKSLDSKEDKMLKLSNKWIDLKRELKSENDKYTAELEKAIKSLNEFKNKAKELGLNANDVKQVKDLSDFVNYAQGTVKDINRITK